MAAKKTPQRLSLPPTAFDVAQQVPQVDAWFRETTDRFNVYAGTANPTVAQVPDGQWIIYRNTTNGEVRIWTNIAGVLKKSAAFT